MMRAEITFNMSTTEMETLTDLPGTTSTAPLRRVLSSPALIYVDLKRKLSKSSALT